MSHGVENDFPGLYGMGVSNAIFALYNKGCAGYFYIIPHLKNDPSDCALHTYTQESTFTVLFIW